VQGPFSQPLDYGGWLDLRPRAQSSPAINCRRRSRSMCRRFRTWSEWTSRRLFHLPQ